MYDFKCVHVLPTGTTPQVRCEGSISGICKDGTCIHYQAHNRYIGACDSSCERIEEINWKRIAVFNNVFAGGAK